MTCLGSQSLLGTEPSIPDERGDAVEEMERKEGQGGGKISVSAFAKLKRARRKLWVKRPTPPDRVMSTCGSGTTHWHAGGVGPPAHIMSLEDSHTQKKEGGLGSQAAILVGTKLPSDQWEVGSRD